MVTQTRLTFPTTFISLPSRHDRPMLHRGPTPLLPMHNCDNCCLRSSSRGSNNLQTLFSLETALAAMATRSDSAAWVVVRALAATMATVLMVIR
jgi:hypothetical protein